MIHTNTTGGRVAWKTTWTKHSTVNENPRDDPVDENLKSQSQGGPNKAAEPSRMKPTAEVQQVRLSSVGVVLC